MKRTDHGDSWFTSRRERRLWAAAALVTAAIAFTLLLGPALMDAIGAQRAFDLAFVLGLLLAAGAVVTLASGTRVRRVELGLALALFATAVLLISRMGLSAAERTHLIEFGVLAALIYAALVERSDHGRLAAWPALVAIAVTVLIGVLDEALQAILPGRVFDPVDILFNTAAAVAAVLASVVLRWWSRRRTTSAAVGEDE